MYKHILIATDGSDLAAKAVMAGLTLAKSIRATLPTVNNKSLFNLSNSRIGNQAVRVYHLDLFALFRET